METLCTMIFHGDLPPIGNAISLQQNPENVLADLLPDNKYWVDSGTSALALALLDAKARFPQVKQPRAIIPGYCCPDLVAACVYAGVEPVAVDIEVNDPAYNLGQLRTHLDERVVAVIAINFLGIVERLTQLREVIAGCGLHTRLIEDNAQWFPSSVNEVDFTSDYVTFSFGRGKPLSLLGGGLLLARAPLAEPVLQQIQKPASQPALLKVKIRAYNLLLLPFLYMFLNRNPFVRLGETKYTSLVKIERLDDYRYTLLTSNFHLYSQRINNLRCKYDEATSANRLQQLVALHSTRSGRLLRYPLLCKDATTRKELLESMRAAGLGATAMYGLAIDKIQRVNGLVSVPSALENANAFADRFMTLPVNADIAPVFQDKILEFIGR
jgi:dTDP-4-amino-4,6-dideoxygalactose transaminase